MLGWSDGGITGLILAAKHPHVVDKLVVWGANAFVLEEDIKAYKSNFHVLRNYVTSDSG